MFDHQFWHDCLLLAVGLGCLGWAVGWAVGLAGLLPDFDGLCVAQGSIFLSDFFGREGG